jgi:cation diffusion facilitator family transporter
MEAEAPQPKRNQKSLYKPPPEQDYANSYKRLIIVILISFVFIGSEIAAGIISNSIAIISDAIHLITDLVGFVFSFLFLYLSKKKPTSKMTFGYHRMELLGALSNLFIIYVLLLFIVFEASERIVAR